MQISSKYIGIVIGLLTFVVLTSGCTSITNLITPSNNYSVNDTSYNITSNTSTTTLSYIDDKFGISFKYPRSWYVFDDYQSGSNMIYASKNINDDVEVQIQIIPTINKPEQDAIKELQESSGPGWSKKETYTIQIDNNTAYEDVFIVNDTNYSKLMRFVNIYFVKNETMYLIMLQAPDKDFDKEKPNFSIIINSFNVK